MNMERVRTGIFELDKLIGGGFIKGSLILLMGHPGAGKTTLAASFIYYGATLFDEKGVYLNFNENKEDFYKYMAGFGMDFERIEKEGKFKYMDALAIIDQNDLDDVIKMLIENVINYGAKRVVIDSLSTITDLLSPEKTRALLSNTFNKIFRKLGVTTILISDVPYGEIRTRQGVEEFVTDTIIVLYIKPKATVYERVLEIRKMRGSGAPLIMTPYIINNEGFKIILPPSGQISGSYDLEKYETGIKELDLMLNGGINKRSLVGIVGPAGSGKSLLSLHIAVHNALKGNKVLYLSFSESEAQLNQKLRLMGYSLDDFKDNLIFKSLNPFTLSKYEMLLYFRQLLTDYKPDIYIVDSLERFRWALGEGDFIDYVQRRVDELKGNGYTTIVNMNAMYPEERVYFDNVADTLLVIRVDLDNDKLKRKLYVCKSSDLYTINFVGEIVIDENRKISIRTTGQ